MIWLQFLTLDICWANIYQTNCPCRLLLLFNNERECKNRGILRDNITGYKRSHIFVLCWHKINRLCCWCNHHLLQTEFFVPFVKAFLSKHNRLACFGIVWKNEKIIGRNIILDVKFIIKLKANGLFVILFYRWCTAFLVKEVKNTVYYTFCN